MVWVRRLVHFGMDWFTGRAATPYSALSPSRDNHETAHDARG